MFIPGVKTAYLYPKQISMNLGEKKLTQICKEEMGLDPKIGMIFIFYNSKLNQLKLFFYDETGSQDMTRLLPKGGFMVPVQTKDEKYI
jgi:hypothetical protein